MKVFLYCSNIGVAKWQYFIFRLHSENFSFSIFDSQFAIFESIVDDLGTKWMINRGQTGRLNDRKWTVISPSILFDRLVLLKTVRFPRKIFSNYFLLLGLSEIISTLQLRSILSNYPLSECDPFTEFSLFYVVDFCFSWSFRAEKSSMEVGESGRTRSGKVDGPSSFWDCPLSSIFNCQRTFKDRPLSSLFDHLRSFEGRQVLIFVDSPLSIFDRPLS